MTTIRELLYLDNKVIDHWWQMPAKARTVGTVGQEESTSSMGFKNGNSMWSGANPMPWSV